MTQLKNSTFLRPYRVWFYVEGRCIEWRRYAKSIYEAFDSAKMVVAHEYPDYQFLNVERIWDVE